MLTGRNPIIALFVTFFFYSCKKELTEVVLFPETEYDLLGAFDETGKPLNLLKDSVSQHLTAFLDNILVDGRSLPKNEPDLFSSASIGDLAIAAKSDVFLTFVQQQAHNTNAIGYYTYPTGQPPTKPEDIEKITYCFASAGNSSPLKPGDKVRLGTFNSGTSIGFVLLSKAWDPRTAKLNNKVVHFCSNDALNPEKDPKLRKHAVLIPYPAENKVLIGFEDMDRTNPACDHDFDDVVLYTTVIVK